MVLPNTARPAVVVLVDSPVGLVHHADHRARGRDDC
jgi:hypothetical protein